MADNMSNRFFQQAIDRAATLSGKPGRILVVVSKLAAKLRHVNWKNQNAAQLKRNAAVFGRMAKAYASGAYREVPWKTVLIILAAILYFINPFDLIPDFIPGLGLTDDFGVLVWVYNSVAMEVDKFLLWERSQLQLLP